MAKVRLKAGDRSPMAVLVRVLESSMRLLHPLMPFVTEAVWQELRRAVEGLEPKAVIAAMYPKGGEGADTEAEELMKVATLEPVPAVRDALGSIVPAEVRKKVQVSVFVDENVPESLAETIRERLIEAAP